MNRNTILLIWSILLFGIFSSVWASNIVDTNTVSFTINNQTGKLNLPEKIFWKTSDIIQQNIIVAQDGWNYAEWVTPPAWTINTTWATRIQDSSGTWEINVIDVPTILDAIRENNLKTTRFQGKKEYGCGFEGWCSVNISILEKINKNFSKLSLSDIEAPILTTNAEKVLYGNLKQIRNSEWKIVGYEVPCTISQDKDNIISFKNYCMVWFNGRYLIEYIYTFPEEFISNYTSNNIKNYYEGNFKFMKESRIFWEKKFKEKYNTNYKFRQIIKQLEINFLNNLEQNKTK